MSGSVRLIVHVKERNGLTPVEILADGAAPLFGLVAEVMRCVASQHPHHSGKPVEAIRYPVDKSR